MERLIFYRYCARFVRSFVWGLGFDALRKDEEKEEGFFGRWGSLGRKDFEGRG